MLKSLHIQNIALIDNAALEFGSGLCVLTGETGAGKSILLDALGLALGNRNDPRLLRHGTTQGSVTAEFDDASELLEAHSLPASDSLILRRVILADGKSRAFVNDAPVSITLLKEIGEELVEIHGQHDQRKLFSPAAQRDILDGFGGISTTALKKAYSVWKEAENALIETEAALKNAHGEADFLQHAAAELSKLKPVVGEESELAEQRQRLMQKEKNITLLDDLLQAVKETPTALYGAGRTLQRSAPQFSNLIDTLEKAGNEASEALAQLEKALDDIREGDANVENVEERLFALRAAARKYQCTPDELAAEHAKITERLQLLASHNERLQKLRKQIAESREAYSSAAGALSEKRKMTAAKLEKAIAKELAPLKMEHAVFKVGFEPLLEAQWGPNGMDNVTFLIQPNKGSSMEPLHKVASGGELSRIMLALKCISADSANMTMIFDEVDTGVSGAVAEAVGKRLHKLGGNSLVLVVTHLPQVAAFGATHFKVRKEVKGNETFTHIETLNVTARREEIARMLAGSTITKEALAAATKLLETAP
jgi:DNA repair protein RecN (Recombination protein N)